MSLLLCRFLGIPLTPDAGNRYTDQPFSLYLLSIVRESRLQMHTTWLFLGVFGALGIAGVLWVMAEKWQQESEWSSQDMLWMTGFVTLLCSSAIAYRISTHSSLARRFAILTTIADVFSLAVALSVPVILWFRWHAPGEEDRTRNDEESFPDIYFPRTILGLQGYPPASRVNRLSESEEEDIRANLFASMQLPLNRVAERSEKTSPRQIKPNEEQTLSEATAMENMNSLSGSLSTQPDVTRSTVQQATTRPLPELPHPLTLQPSVQERAKPAFTSFREQLTTLNASWRKIEETGKEVEDWFQDQQKLVLSHLERPAGKGHNSHPEFSSDFLERKMHRVDAEWAAIHQTIREMYRWLEGNTSDKETPQETKVW